MSPEPEDSPHEALPRDGSLQTNSCLLCKQRKVKCDKRYPCAACTRAHVQCIFRAPAPPRRGKRRPDELSLLARLKRYEDMLQSLGVKIEDVKVEEAAAGLPPTKDGLPPESVRATFHAFSGGTGPPDALQNIQGTLVAEEGKSMYFDNILWKSLSDALPDANEVLNSSDEEEVNENWPQGDHSASEGINDMVFSPASSTSIQILHPLPSQVIRLWQVYIDAVNPLCMILHQPTTYKSIIAATADLSNLPKNLEALLFAIYTIAIYTMEPRDCEDLFIGEKKSALLQKYQFATRLALQKAGLLKCTDQVTLQAFVLYLFSVRATIDPRILWIYTGIAVRIAQRIGMHRDGTYLSIGPFETEMRRRLWWQVVVLDSYASQLSGTGTSLSSESWDTILPLNINDEDIWPEMTEPPKEREGATEMFFCMSRFEFGRVFRPKLLEKMQGAGVMSGKSIFFLIPLDERDRMLDEAEKRVSEQYLRFADPFNDLHILTLGVARAALSSVRLMCHHPRQYPDGGASLPQAERDRLFQSALKIIEYDRNASSSRALRRFRWHVGAFFQIHAFVFVLNELCQRTEGREIFEAWKLVDDTYVNHPELMYGSKRTVIIALCNITLKAWRKFEAGKQVPRPGFIDKMLQRKLGLSQRSKAAESAAASSSSGQDYSQTAYTTPSMQASSGSAQYPSPSQTGSTGSSAPEFRAPQSVDTYGEFVEAPGYYSLNSTPMFGGPDAYTTRKTTDEAMLPDVGLENDTSTMDWAAWDNLIQESALEGFNDIAFGVNFNS